MNLKTRRTQDRTIFRMKAFATLFSAVLMGASALIATGQWTDIDAPIGAPGTVLNGINDMGQIVGL